MKHYQEILITLLVATLVWLPNWPIAFAVAFLVALRLGTQYLEYRKPTPIPEPTQKLLQDFEELKSRVDAIATGLSFKTRSLN